MLCVRGQTKGKTMLGSEQSFLALVIAAFGLFAVVLAYADLTTAETREQAKH